MSKSVLVSATVVSAAMLSIAGPATATYAGGGHGGGGKSPSFTLSLAPSTASLNQTVNQSAVQLVTFTISRTGASKDIANCDSRVNYATMDGSAAGSTDYTLESGTAVISAGALSTTVQVPLVHETDNAPDKDADETFSLSINSPFSSLCPRKTSAVAANLGTSTVTIQDGRTALHVPNGDTVSLTNMSLNGCDPLTATLDFRPMTAGAAAISPLALGSQSGCGTTNLSDKSWSNTTGGDVAVTLDLNDTACSTYRISTVNLDDHYYSDTTSIVPDANSGNGSPVYTNVNHAAVTGAGPWSVAITDSDGCGGSYNTWRVPRAGDTGALLATVAIAPTGP